MITELTQTIQIWTHTSSMVCYTRTKYFKPRPFMKQPAGISPASFQNLAGLEFFFFFNHWFQKRILWMFPSSALCSFSFLSLRAADFSSVVCVTVCEVFTSSWSSVGGSELVHSQWTGSQPADDHLLCIGWNQHSVRHVLTVCELTIDSTQVDLMFVADTKLSANSRCTFSLLRLVHPQIVRKPMCSYFLLLFFSKLLTTNV